MVVQAEGEKLHAQGIGAESADYITRPKAQSLTPGRSAETEFHVRIRLASRSGIP
jgi:hypothetical protein